VRVVLVLVLSLFMLEHYDEDDHDPWVAGDALDVEAAFLAAFLEAPLEKPIYIEFPPMYREYCESRGFEIADDHDCIEVSRSQYGQAEATRNWTNLLVKILTSKEGIAMKQCKRDLCVFVKHNDDGQLILMLVSYIDDVIVAGKRSQVEKLKECLRKRVTITDIGRVQTHLGVDNELEKDGKGYYWKCSMYKCIDTMIKDFEQHTKKETSDYPTPGKPSNVLEKNLGEPVDESNYRRYVGKALFAVRKVLPDCGNAVRDQTKHISNPRDEHWKSLDRLMGYLKHRRMPLKLRAPNSVGHHLVVSVQVLLLYRFVLVWSIFQQDNEMGTFVSSSRTAVGSSLCARKLQKEEMSCGEDPSFHQCHLSTLFANIH